MLHQNCREELIPFFVSEGDNVQKGQLLATLESKEIDAKVEQARGVLAAAQARMTMAHNGARPEEKEAVGNQYQAAKHQFETGLIKHSVEFKKYSRIV